MDVGESSHLPSPHAAAAQAPVRPPLIPSASTDKTHRAAPTPPSSVDPNCEFWTLLRPQLQAERSAGWLVLAPDSEAYPYPYSGPRDGDAEAPSNAALLRRPSGNYGGAGSGPGMSSGHSIHSMQSVRNSGHSLRSLSGSSGDDGDSGRGVQEGAARLRYPSIAVTAVDHFSLGNAEEQEQTAAPGPGPGPGPSHTVPLSSPPGAAARDEEDVADPALLSAGLEDCSAPLSEQPLASLAARLLASLAVKALHKQVGGRTGQDFPPSLVPFLSFSSLSLLPSLSLTCLPLLPSLPPYVPLLLRTDL